MDFFFWVIGGDFNIIRYTHERKEGEGHGHDRHQFNDLTDQTDLVDFPIADRFHMDESSSKADSS